MEGAQAWSRSWAGAGRSGFWWRQLPRWEKQVPPTGIGALAGALEHWDGGPFTRSGGALRSMSGSQPAAPEVVGAGFVCLQVGVGAVDRRSPVTNL
ncbi:hypothetical protein CCHR01_15264 [Colletotrichum chrysophilum]|uniref:Uncharacterized protein n=1 Tax=Colletotrichum chrysophilum TaxID=1836956 RepID=A0AAD9AAU9_9PEZI|nr:hypothetical protein CCHR01_15264 [Colletotrichum chrysophilum]